MHFLFCNVDPSIWRFTSCMLTAETDVVDNYLVLPKTLEAMGAEYLSAAPTVLAQPKRQLRDIHKHHMQSNVVD